MFEKPLISFDFAIKFLLKSKEDYEIIEGFLSALFVANNYKPVKITALLESESNKEAAHLKKSVADLIVEDTDGNKFIVEIERSFTPNFTHKACFNTARLISDSLSTSQDYSKIQKIFHISLLYFETAGMEKPIYHGKTIIHEVDTEHPINIDIMNKGIATFENKNIFPEYFFISIPRFNDQIRSEMDEWLYMMKNSEVKADFKSPYMARVAKRLKVLRMTDEERIEYHKYLKESAVQEDILNAANSKGLAEGLQKGMSQGLEKGRKEGREEGREEGAKLTKIEVAKTMLVKGLDINLISQISELSIDEIMELKN